jgi:nitrilase
MRVAACQLAPVLLDRAATLEKVLTAAEAASAAGAALAAFPEAVLPGYPCWLALTGGAAFDDPLQKAIHARYLDQAVELPGPELDRLREAASDLALSLVVGVVERGRAAGRGTLWCTALSVGPEGDWLAHRKLVPTHEERLAWGPGDGAGLRVRPVQGWRVGVLNCWENWMPAARLALLAQGEEVHVSLWPGRPELTRDVSRFTAREGRVHVVAASGVLRVDDLPADLPGRAELARACPSGLLHSGGSRIVAADGRELASLDEPDEGIVTAELGRSLLDGERQNLDPSGHYHRPDVFTLRVDRRRREALELVDRDPQ